MKLKDFFEIARPKQALFKNSIILIALLFSIEKFPVSLLPENLLFIILGGLALGLASSASYIINDIFDYEKDKNHPEKRKRPIPSGRLQRKPALIFALALLLVSLAIAIVISAYSSWIFFIMVCLLFIFSLAYTFYFRNIILLDIIIISINFSIRAISGVFIIKGGEMSYWILLCTFFLSLFMTGSKRLAETELDGIKCYRKGYCDINRNFLIVVIAMSISMVFTFFSIYSILNSKPLLLLSAPIALYIALSYFGCIYKNPQQIRNPEEFVFKRKTLIGILLWVVVVIFALYFSIPK